MQVYLVPGNKWKEECLCFGNENTKRCCIFFFEKIRLHYQKTNTLELAKMPWEYPGHFLIPGEKGLKG